MPSQKPKLKELGFLQKGGGGQGKNEAEKNEEDDDNEEDGSESGQVYVVQPDHEHDSRQQGQNRLLRQISLSLTQEISILIGAVFTGK
jgi:hypothetical protein